MQMNVDLYIRFENIILHKYFFCNPILNDLKFFLTNCFLICYTTFTYFYFCASRTILSKNNFILGGFMKKLLFSLFLFFSLLFLIICIATFVTYSNYSFTTSPTEYDFSNSDYTWPLPSYHTISSPFGFRISPTTGASSYHSGIDIPAPEGTSIYSIHSGIVTYLNFNGANGYTVMIENNNMTFSYSHISPNFMVALGDSISQNQPIATVGPKYIQAIPNNPYMDVSRSANKWCYNWLSSTFGHKNRWQSHRSSKTI